MNNFKRVIFLVIEIILKMKEKSIWYFGWLWNIHNGKLIMKEKERYKYILQE